MMMSAMRRSARSRRPSSKSKRLSRHSSLGDHDPHPDPSTDQRHRAASSEDGRTRSGEQRRARPASARKPSETSKHGDVVDSGIDSGNGVVEPDSPQNKLRRSRSSDSEGGDKGEQTPSLVPNGVVCHPERPPVPTKDSSATGHEPETLERHPPSPHRKRRSKSKHKSDKAASADSEDRVTSKPPVAGKNSESAERSSVDTNPSVSATTPSDRSPSHSHHSYASSPSIDSSQTMTGEVIQNNSDTAAKEGSVENDSAASSQARQDDRPLAGEDEQAASPRREVKAVTWRDGEDEAILTPEAQERKRRLEARLAQAKHSLESPHVNAAVEGYELPEGPQVEAPDHSLLQQFRLLFQQELTRLRTELDSFRQFCARQMEREAANVYSSDQHHQSQQPTNDEASSETTETSTQTNKAAEQQQRAKGDVKSEEDIQKLEDKLADRQKDLLEYEKEILEVEAMLNQRQAICERRQSALMALDEELQSLREDIFNKNENLKSETDDNAEKARKNWDLVRRHLTDKQAMLEATVQRYRTQLASANASLAAKDTLVAHLQKQLKESKETLQEKEKKLSRMEDKLAFASEEMLVLRTMQDEQRQGLTHEPHPPPTAADPLSLSQQSRRSSTFARPSSSRSSLQRQTSGSEERRSPVPASMTLAQRRMSVIPAGPSTSGSSRVPTATAPPELGSRKKSSAVAGPARDQPDQESSGGRRSQRYNRRRRSNSESGNNSSGACVVM